MLVLDGMSPVVIPTPDFRDVYAYAMAYYETGSVAPTPEVLLERFGQDYFLDHGLNIYEDVEETIEWAIEDLKSLWVQQQTGIFVRKLSQEIGSAPPEDRIKVLSQGAAELSSMVLDLSPRTTQVDFRTSGSSLMSQYEMASQHEGIRGMRLGLREVDEHLGGIWPGEMAIIAGPAGSGKSFAATYVAYNEWSRGRSTVLFTLENSIEMNEMRLACCALHFNIRDLQSGKLSDEQVTELREWCGDVLSKSDTPLYIASPEAVNRSPQALVQQAKAREAQALVIDQLTHIANVSSDSGRMSRADHVTAILRTLGDQIKEGRHPVPCLLLHQINREGIKVATSTGRLNMVHGAESAETERQASVLMGLYQSEDDKQVGEMSLQMLKQRRVESKSWRLGWQPWMGLIHVMNEMDFRD